MDDDGCKIADKLNEIHEWAHVCLKSLDKKELHEAHQVGHKILDMLNEMRSSNPVKFLAVFEVLSVGADVLENDCTCMRSSSTVTIH